MQVAIQPIARRAAVYLLILLLLFLGIAWLPGVWVRRVLERYSSPPDRYPGTGAELARLLLEREGVTGVSVEPTEQGDHYDPTARSVRLSNDNFEGRSLTAITVAAHEVGHAVQHHVNYAPLRIRTRLVRLIQPLQKLGAAVLVVSPFIGILTRAPQLGILMFLGGMASLLTSTLVHFVTLPTEIDASFGRALPMLDRHDILKARDKPHARRLLTAAAMTYVAASLMSLLNIARWFAILRR